MQPAVQSMQALVRRYYLVFMDFVIGGIIGGILLFQLNQRLTKNLKLFLSLSISFKMIIIFLIHATIATLDQVFPLSN